MLRTVYQVSGISWPLLDFSIFTFSFWQDVERWVVLGLHTSTDLHRLMILSVSYSLVDCDIKDTCGLSTSMQPRFQMVVYNTLSAFTTVIIGKCKEPIIIYAFLSIFLRPSQPTSIERLQHDKTVLVLWECCTQIELSGILARSQETLKERGKTNRYKISLLGMEDIDTVVDRWDDGRTSPSYYRRVVWAWSLSSVTDDRAEDGKNVA